MLKAGKQYLIKRYHKTCNTDYRHKLLAMGFIPGACFKVLRVAPLGDPVQIEIRGFLISLRKNEASCLELEEAKA